LRHHQSSVSAHRARTVRIVKFAAHFRHDCRRVRFSLRDGSFRCATSLS
jgi:hypothetical protein